jgi:hypothetical protein
LVQVLEHYGAALGAEGPYQDAVRDDVEEETPGLTDKEYKKRTVIAAKKKSVAIGFLKRADRKRYGGLWSELENLFTRGEDQYPTDLTGAYNLLLNYKAPLQQTYGRRDGHANREEEEVSGITFLQNSGPIPGTDGAIHELIKCYNCQSQGHYASACPQDNREQVGVQLLQMSHGTTTDDSEEEYISEFSFLNVGDKTDDFNFHQSDTSCDIIPNSRTLLDSQSTVLVFKNRDFLSNIRPSKSTLRVHTNGGIQTSSLKGTVRNFGEVWFNTDSLANILSMAAVRKVCRITMDTSVEAAMIVHRKDGSMMKFKEYKSGLYYYDAGKHKAATSNTRDKNEDYIF